MTPQEALATIRLIAKEDAHTDGRYQEIDHALTVLESAMNLPDEDEFMYYDLEDFDCRLNDLRSVLDSAPLHSVVEVKKVRYKEIGSVFAIWTDTVTLKEFPTLQEAEDEAERIRKALTGEV